MFFDNDSALPPVIGMNQRVHQRFPNGLMYDRVIFAEEVRLQSKRNLQISRQPLDDPEIKLEEVAGPGTVEGDAIRPSDTRILG